MASKRECSICLSSFTNPKIIPCFHTFCEDCLKDHVINSSDGNTFLCPLCRTKINIPKGGVVNFSKNFYIEEDAIDSKRDESETIKQLKILTCMEHHQDLNLFCENCGVPLCETCWLFHHRRHKVRSIQELFTPAVKGIISYLDILKSVGREYDSLLWEFLLTVTGFSINVHESCSTTPKSTQREKRRQGYKHKGRNSIFYDTTPIHRSQHETNCVMRSLIELDCLKLFLHVKIEEIKTQNRGFRNHSNFPYNPNTQENTKIIEYGNGRLIFNYKLLPVIYFYIIIIILILYYF